MLDYSLRIVQYKVSESGDVIFDHLDFKWKTAPPTKPGWYWARDKETFLQIVRVFLADHGNAGNRLEVWLDTYESEELSDYTHWLGPLPVPEPPDEKGS